MIARVATAALGAAAALAVTGGGASGRAALPACHVAPGGVLSVAHTPAPGWVIQACVFDQRQADGSVVQVGFSHEGILPLSAPAPICPTVRRLGRWGR